VVLAVHPEQQAYPLFFKVVRREEEEPRRQQQQVKATLLIKQDMGIVEEQEFMQLALHIPVAVVEVQ
jgi:hypothetical protein